MDTESLAYAVGGMPGILSLVNHSRNNVMNGTALQRPDGRLSTIYTASEEDPRLNGGRPTLFPTIWDGQELPIADAIERSLASGQQWPAFNNHHEATQAAKWLSPQLPTTAQGWQSFQGLR
jgi:hypothetical protein